VDVSVSRALLYGSVARGDHGTDSDVDILVVSPEFDDVAGARRGRPFRDAWNYDSFGAVDFLTYTPDEYEEFRERPNSLIKTAEGEGVQLDGRGTTHAP